MKSKLILGMLILVEHKSEDCHMDRTSPLTLPGWQGAPLTLGQSQPHLVRWKKGEALGPDDLTFCG